MNPSARVTVRVPASTSNLGPGFDCLGMALSLYNELTLELYPEPGPASFEISGEGAGSLASDESNLMARAARLVLPSRIADNRLIFRAKNTIPLGRGLGSSAAAALCGLYAANSLLRPSILKEEELLKLACKLEGHPDNAAAAVSGGLVVALPGTEGLQIVSLKPHKDLAVVVCVPDFELPTKKARAVLPRQVPLSDAVFNVSRGLLLASALERGRWELLGQAMEDRLHQPRRAPLIPGLGEVISAARETGSCGAALSGAGSSVVAFCRNDLRSVLVGRRMRSAFLEHGVKSRILTLNCDLKGVMLSRDRVLA